MKKVLSKYQNEKKELKKSHKSYKEKRKDSVGNNIFKKGTCLNSSNVKDNLLAEFALLNKLQRMKDLQLGLGFFPAVLIKVSDIRVIFFDAERQERAPIVQEVSNNLLKFKTPRFIARAVVEIPPLPKGASIQVGWIQVLTDLNSKFTFENNKFLSWEIPTLVNGEHRMVNDSNDRLFPWYDPDNALFYAEGPTDQFAFPHIALTDEPGGSAFNFIPDKENQTNSTLSHAYLKYRFISYLVLKNFTEDSYHIIKAISWCSEMAIAMDPNKELGDRVVFVGPCEQKEFIVLSDESVPALEENVLKPPSANDSLMLVVRSENNKPELFQKADKETVDLNKYLNETNEHTLKILKFTHENYLLHYEDEP